MSVTRRRASKSPRKNRGLATVRNGLRPITGLKDLACFLNFQFESGGQEWTKLNHPLNLLLFRPRRPLEWQEAKELQAEILKDLLPVIAPEPWQIAGLYALLESLVEKVNSLKLVNAWDILPCDTRWLRRYGQPGWEINSQSEVLQPIRPFERVVKVGGFKWLFRKTQVGARVRERLYRIVVDVIETGELMKLKKCQECSKFFVAEDPREKLCGPKCRKIHENKGVKDRMKKYRRKVDEKIKAEGLRKLSKLATLIRRCSGRTIGDLIHQIPEISRLRQHLGEKWGEFIAVVGDIRNSRSSSEPIWENFSSQMKKALAEAPIKSA